MTSIAYDIGYLSASLDILENYLLSRDVYWALGAASPTGEPPYPRLTLGGVLLSKARLEARALAGAGTGQFEQLEQRLAALQQRWRVAWENKASREFSVRLRLWGNFLDDYRTSPGGNLDRYAYEVGRRVMLELLQPTAAEIASAEAELLHGMDQFLRSRFIPGDFIWAPDLAAGFPPQTYWYLYGSPQSDKTVH